MANQPDLRTLAYDCMGDILLYVGGSGDALTLNTLAYDCMGDVFAIANANSVPAGVVCGFPFVLFMKET